MPDLILTSMKIWLTTNEIKSAVRKPKNNKIPAKDKISADIKKSAPDIVYVCILLKSTAT